MTSAAARRDTPSPITVPVPLGDRAYDILVGRGLIEDGRIAHRGAWRPRRRHRDRRACGPALCRCPGPIPRGAGPARFRRHPASGRGDQVLCQPGAGLRCGAGGKDRARRPRGGARRRRGRRSRGLRRSGGAPGRALRPGADHPALPGRFLGRRQDRHQFPPRQEPRRRLPSAEPGAGRHRAPRHAARCARCAPAMRRWRSTASSTTHASSPGAKPTGRASSPAGRSGTRPWRRAAAPRPMWWCATSTRTATARCSISATPSVTRSNGSRAYDSARLVHGEGVAIGLTLAFRFSAFLGLAPAADAERVESASEGRRAPHAPRRCSGRLRHRRSACSTRWRRTRR